MAILTVTGFSGDLCALNGIYQQQEFNHGKPTYKKHAEADGTTQCVFFWDERDGAALSGWWMAPEVGGEQVWAHIASKKPTPPTRGWKVPWQAAPDPKVVMELKQGLLKSGVKRKALGAILPADPRAREKNLVQANAGTIDAHKKVNALHISRELAKPADADAQEERRAREAEEQNELRRQAEEKLQEVARMELLQRQAEENIEQEALARKLLCRVKPYERKVDDIRTKMEDLESRAPPNLADSAKDYTEKLERLKKDVDAIEALIIEAKAWLDENTPTSGPGMLREPHRLLSRLKSRCASFLYKCRRHAQEARALEYGLSEKIRVDLAVSLRAYLEKKKISAAQEFESLFKNETIDLCTFSEFARKLCKDVPCFEAMLKSTVGTTTISKEHFEVLSGAAYRCIKRALITDVIEVKSCKRLRQIEPEEIVEVVHRHEFDAQTNLVRFRGRVNDGLEGYVTIRGNKGSSFFRLQQNGYRVVKETVFTDKFNMTDFKVIYHLKEGYYIRGLTNPQLEEKSKLWRMKAQAVDGKGNGVGWVTLKGNHGSTFLINCELPGEKVMEHVEELEMPDEEEMSDEENEIV